VIRERLRESGDDDELLADLTSKIAQMKLACEAATKSFESAITKKNEARRQLKHLRQELQAAEEANEEASEAATAFDAISCRCGIRGGQNSCAANACPCKMAEKECGSGCWCQADNDVECRNPHQSKAK
jgi:uncharacterized protein YukE